MSDQGRSLSRLAIADPPYLGRADRWYGAGRGSGGGRHRADQHPAAAEWDRLERHLALLEDLALFDGWALFTGAAALRPILEAAPPDVRVLSWHVTNAVPSGSRVLAGWEPVIVRIPTGRRARGTGLAVRDCHVAAAPRLGFAGAKPPSVTRWLLDVLGYDPDTDEVHDLFAGSGSVAAAAAQLVMTPARTTS